MVKKISTRPHRQLYSRVVVSLHKPIVLIAIFPPNISESLSCLIPQIGIAAGMWFDHLNDAQRFIVLAADEDQLVAALAPGGVHVLGFELNIFWAGEHHAEHTNVRRQISLKSVRCSGGGAIAAAAGRPTADVNVHIVNVENQHESANKSRYEAGKQMQLPRFELNHCFVRVMFCPTRRLTCDCSS